MLPFFTRRSAKRHVGSAPASSTDPSWDRCYETQLRAAQLGESLTSVSAAMVAPLVAAFGLVAVFWATAERGFVLGVLVATATLSAMAIGAAKLAVFGMLNRRAVKVAQSLAIWLAALVGVIWGTVPVALFANADSDGRLVIVAALAGAISNAYRFGPVHRISLFYVAPICAGSFLGLAASGSSGAFLLSILMPLYGWLVVVHCDRINALSARRIADHLRVAEQDDTIQALLLDFDENASDWIWRTDETGRLLDVSDRFGSVAGRPAAVIEGDTLESVLVRCGDSSPTNGARAVLATLAARKPFRNQLVEIKTDGPSHWWRLSGRPLHDAEGTFLGYHGIGSDMTGARNSESRIAYLANHDALTGLANRTSFQNHAARQCEAAVIDGHCRALICLDLDGFKSVNDNLGHEGGDEMLRQVTGRLTSVAPAEAFIARLGGDEFALWVETPPAKAEAIAHALVDALRRPFDIHGRQTSIGTSAGIAFAPKHATEPDSLMIKADVALYRAKAEGKGQVRVFVEAFETAMIERRKLEADLKLGLARGEFELHYQPQVDAANGAVRGFEALIRWHSPERGFVPPADFIPVAENAGLIPAIGRWVLFEACKAAAKWPSDIQIAVNVSPAQVRAADFMQDIAMALKRSGLHPSRLEVEVTEGVFLDKSSVALENLRTLRTRGARVALDDFGTGYSSLSYLVAFPVDKIKIDRSFIRDLVGSSANLAIVDAILALARSLSIKVTAEGVETKEQALLLKRRRCHELQGYLFSRPRPEADVPDMIETAPQLFRQAIPTRMDSPLALVLEAARKRAMA